jgi:hypothetical protein
MDKLRKALRSAILSDPHHSSDDIERVFRQTLRDLLGEGEVPVPDDYMLTHLALEVRCQQLLQSMGLQVEPGRDGKEDLIVRPPSGASPEEPMAVEVKSGKDPSPGIEQLRQLDDWVFDLSQEEQVRKRQRGFGLAPLGITPAYSHPTPHKGVFIYNGPINMPFDRRADRWLGYNEEQFAIKRHFSIISFPLLIAVAAEFQKDRRWLAPLWNLIHTTSGLLQPQGLLWPSPVPPETPNL